MLQEQILTVIIKIKGQLNSVIFQHDYGCPARFPRHVSNLIPETFGE